MMNEWILSSSLLIAAMLLGRRLLRGKISLRLQYALWGLVLLRLLLPVQLFASDFGAGTIAREVDLSEPVRQVYVSAYENRYELAYDEAYQWVSDTYAARGQTVDPGTIEWTAQQMAREEQEVELKGLLNQIWLTGMAAMTAVILACNLHLSLRLRSRRWGYPAADCLLPVYITQVLPTPCIFGVFRPVIYLTPQAAKEEQVRSHVLLHEQTHYRHGDHVWSVLRSMCLVLHWYNPLVWLAVKASKIDAELACDEGVLVRLGERHRGDYGRTLVGLTCAAPLSDFLLTATTMTGSAGSIRQRIKLLMAHPRNTILTLTAVIVIGTLVVGCAFAGAPETTEPSEPAETLQETPLKNASFALPMDMALSALAGENPRMLTAEEITQVNDAFTSTFYNGKKDEYFVNAVASFFTSSYIDVCELDFAEFLRQFPVSGEATEEEFQLLRQKYGARFDWAEHETLQNMPVPVHRYDSDDIDAVTRRYANLPVQEIQDRDSVYYLEETDAYYNFTSDFSPGMFCCVEGFVYDGGAVLYSTNMALLLTEAAGQYTIQAHLPLLPSQE